jgi:hypothetical protein
MMEERFNWLVGREREHLVELIEAFHVERDHGLRCWLLQLIGQARAPETLPLFRELLLTEDTPFDFRIWAVYGLHDVGTKEARCLLFELRSWTFADEWESEEFQAAVRGRP